MKRVQFVITRSPEFTADVSLELYGDLGGGVIDFNRPLAPGRTRLWPAAPLIRGHLLDGHLAAVHLDATVTDGHLTGPHLLDGHLNVQLAIVVLSPRYVFGRFQHALRFVDGAGNLTAQGDHTFVQTINDAPDAPGGLRRIGWDGTQKRVCFAFKPVRLWAVAGA